MPGHVRRELLTAAQRAELLALPTDRLEIRERYLLTPTDFDLINRDRTAANRQGWEHINLTGDYVWRPGRWRPEQPPPAFASQTSTVCSLA